MNLLFGALHGEPNSFDLFIPLFQRLQEKIMVRYISSDDKVLAKAKHYKDLFFDAAMEELTPLPQKMSFKKMTSDTRITIFGNIL